MSVEYAGTERRRRPTGDHGEVEGAVLRSFEEPTRTTPGPVGAFLREYTLGLGATLALLGAIVYVGKGYIDRDTPVNKPALYEVHAPAPTRGR